MAGQGAAGAVRAAQARATADRRRADPDRRADARPRRAVAAEDAAAVRHRTARHGREAGAGGDPRRPRARRRRTHRTRHNEGPAAAQRHPGPPVPPGDLPEGSPLLVFFHGGGFAIGDIDSHDHLCRFLARNAGVRVLSVGYRLAPEDPFPAAVDDCVTAFKWAAAEATSLGADPKLIALGGDSAGGNLAAVTALQVGTGNPRPVFLLLLYPTVDATTRRRSRELFGYGYFLTDTGMDWFMERYVPDPETRSDP
ncbi:alpha/beta hydrolase, partial [Kutzneria kofuensis]|uniref:alpha/beta hydrolase n=1 Tax=Kutzneria kofuensis TaxID=103725 RepID=UPI0031EA2B91